MKNIHVDLNNKHLSHFKHTISNHSFNKTMSYRKPCCTLACEDCQNHGKGLIQELCTGRYCPKHGAECPLCHLGICQYCKRQERYHDELTCCEFSRGKRICPSCTFTCTVCRRKEMCARHRAYIVMFSFDYSDEEESGDTCEMTVGLGSGVCIDCAYQQTVAVRSNN